MTNWIRAFGKRFITHVMSLCKTHPIGRAACRGENDRLKVMNILFTTYSQRTFYEKNLLTRTHICDSLDLFLRERCSLTDRSAWKASSGIGSALGINTGRKSGNGRDELAFPAPWVRSFFKVKQTQGQCHRFPRGGSYRPRVIRPGNQAVSDAEPVRPDQRSAQPVAKPSHAPTSGLRSVVCEHSRSQTDRCYCEPVWREWIPRLRTTRNNRTILRCRSREGRKRIRLSRAEDGRWKAPMR